MSFSHAVKQSLYLLSVAQFGPASYWGLIEHYGSLDAVFTQPVRASKYCKPAMQQALSQSHNLGEQAPLWQHVEVLCAWLEDQGIHVLVSTDSDYPLLLKAIDKPPPLLFVKGHLDALALPQIAIVGSRKITASGEKTTHTFAKELAQAGFVVTSGLALGVDNAAHQGALDGNGRTVAVMATGIDTVYPAKHRVLAQQIIDQGGALVTEFFPHSAPKAHHFPQRNRIISGLSCGLLVVEAALKSGSLISARYATEQNREVFAVPGSIHSPVSRGCHSLIKSGAKLVETAQDIVQELGSMLSLHADELAEYAITKPLSKQEGTDKSNNISSKNKGLHPVKKAENQPDQLATDCAVLRCIDFSITPLDDILTYTNQTIDEIMPRLLELELEGWISHNGAGYTRLR